MTAPKQVPHTESKNPLYSRSAQHEHVTGERPNGGERNGSVMENLKSHINEFCLYPQGNGTLLRDFQQESDMIGFMFYKDHPGCSVENELDGSKTGGSCFFFFFEPK